MTACGTILAIDPSSRGCGFAEGVPGFIPLLQTVKFHTDETDTEIEIFGRAADYLEKRLADQSPAVIAIERPLVVAKGYHHDPTITLGLFGIFTGLAKARGIRVIPVSIVAWRAFFLGRGRGKLAGSTAKAEAIRICRALKWNPPDHNAAEAAGIFLYACSIVAPNATRPEPLFTGAQTS